MADVINEVPTQMSEVKAIRGLHLESSALGSDGSFSTTGLWVQFDASREYEGTSSLCHAKVINDSIDDSIDTNGSVCDQLLGSARRENAPDNPKREMSEAAGSSIANDDMAIKSLKDELLIN
jgi:hypothetical protein